MKTNLPTRHKLDIFISAHCWQCPEAQRLALEMQKEFSTLIVNVIDLDQPNTLKPAFVFSVPTFALDDKVVSLGTPTREILDHKIRRALEME